MVENDSSTMTLRARPGFFWTGVMCAAVTMPLCIWHVALSITHDKSIANPVAFAVVGGVISLFFILLSIYLIGFSFKYRLIVSEDIITQFGVFTVRSINVADIQSAKWRNRPAGGSVKFVGGTRKMVIAFDNFKRSEAGDLIKRLHCVMPNAKHLGWEKSKLRALYEAASSKSVE